MRGSRKFCHWDPTLATFFDEGREDSINTKSEPLSVHQQNAIFMAFRWRADDGPTSIAGLVALRFFRGSGLALLRNSIFFVIFPSSGSAYVSLRLLYFAFK